ncbi:MAG: hypothetical protein AAGA70_02380 [Pseudomonadota bacterium]
MTLYVFALNTAVEVTHTALTRAQGQSAGLPPLGDWLGLEGLDTDRIELFAVADLADMALSSYLHSAYDVIEEPLSYARNRLDALSGAVLLVPDVAMSGKAKPGPEATLIARLPLAQPDRRLLLVPSAPPEAPDPQPTDPQPQPAVAEQGRAGGWIVAIASAVAVLLIWVAFS